MIIIFLQIPFIYGMNSHFLNVEQNECPICYECIQKNNSIRLPCNHALCIKCCFDCFIQNIEKCPICRDLQLKNKNIHYFSDTFIKNMVQENNYTSTKLSQILYTFGVLGRSELCEDLVHEYKIDVNFKRVEGSGETVLHGILDSYDIPLENEFKIFKFFVEKLNADMTVKNIYGETLLHYAAAIGNLEIIEYILENTKFSIDETDDENSSIFVHLLLGNFLAEDLKLASVKFLFEEHNPDIFIENIYGHTPFFLALKQGCFDIFEYFISKVDKTINYFEEKFYLHEIILSLEVNEESKLRAVKYLLENYNVSTKTLKNGRSVLHDATQLGHLKILDYLIPFCDINFRTEEDGLTPLLLAVVSEAILESERINLIDFLIKRGANVNVKSKAGNTPLGLSIMFRDEALVKFFIDHKTVNVNVINENKVPTIMLLIIRNFEWGETRVKIFKYFLDHRREINPILNTIRSYNGGTCLHLACHFGYLDLIDFLLKNTNLNLSDVDDAGNTVWHYVATSSEIQEKQKIKILKYFRKKFDSKKIVYANGTSLLHECIFFGFLDVSLYLIQTMDINLNIQDIFDHTPIHTLLMSDRIDEKTKLDFLKLLIKTYDANVFTLNHKKETLLHFCAEFGFQTILDFLIFEKQLIIDQKDCEGHTPLLGAIALSTMDNDEILSMVRHLVEKHGANIYIKNNLAMKLSFENNNFAVYQYLSNRQKNKHIRHDLTPFTMLNAMGINKYKK